MTIRTPDQRLRVFVSSTLEELADERQAARRAIEGLRLTPVMFELGARPHPPRALYRAYLEQSDVFIGLYWQRYGWVAPGEDVSGLEDEYRSAGGRPKLIYLKEPADREPRLKSLLTLIRADGQASYRRFTKPGELRTLIADDLAVLLSERFGPGGNERPVAPLLPANERPLPRPLTRLIGRAAEVEQLAGMLADPSRRLVTVVGPGGIGKTRLALAVAERVRAAYADGVYFVPLAALAEPRLVVPTIARALGIPENGRESIDVTLRRALHSAHCLIVLDNMEHLAGAASDVLDLLGASPGLQILATSRSVLDVSGESIFMLGPLEVPTETDEHTAAVELFFDRVNELRPGFVPTDDDQRAIGELVRRLDGLPLAIELAAAQVRVLTPRALLERMGHRRLRMLRSARRDLPPRQQTLRETIGWSYELLRQSERVLFERLSVFVGSADLASIEAVVDPEGELDTMNLLASLLEASLVRTIGDAGDVRFGMLETTREFANERLEASGQAEGYRNRHGDHYVAMAAEGALGVRGSGQLEWLARLDRENDNFRAVLRRAIRQGDAANGARLGLLLCWFWQMRSLYAEGRSWMEAVRGIGGATPYDRAVAWTVEALLAIWQGDFGFVEAGVDEAVAGLRNATDAPTLGLALLLKAAVGGVEYRSGPSELVALEHVAEGGPSSAQEAAVEADALLSAAGDPFLQGVVLLGRSYVARRLGRFDEAAVLAERALGLSTSVGDSYVRSSASTLLAATALQRRAVADVRTHARRALSTARALGNLSSSGLALELLAAAELEDGRPEQAGRLYALARRAYGLAHAQPWRPDALHDSMSRLQQELGPRLDELVAGAHALDLDTAISELAPPAG